MLEENAVTDFAQNTENAALQETALWYICLNFFFSDIDWKYLMLHHFMSFLLTN